jgi:hypothetical protein
MNAGRKDGDSFCQWHVINPNSPLFYLFRLLTEAPSYLGYVVLGMKAMNGRPYFIAFTLNNFQGTSISQC